MLLVELNYVAAVCVKAGGGSIRAEWWIYCVGGEIRIRSEIIYFTRKMWYLEQMLECLLALVKYSVKFCLLKGPSAWDVECIKVLQALSWCYIFIKGLENSHKKSISWDLTSFTVMAFEVSLGVFFFNFFFIQNVFGLEVVLDEGIVTSGRGSVDCIMNHVILVFCNSAEKGKREGGYLNLKTAEWM